MLKVFAKHDSQFEHQEIGQARSILLISDTGDRYDFKTVTAGNQQVIPKEIFLDGWMTPVDMGTAAFSPIIMDTGRADEIRKYKTLIAVLVEMMGGAVTIQSSEAERADRLLTLTHEIKQDPWMYVLKTEEKQ